MIQRMNRLIAILKIMSTVTFLFVMMSDEHLTMPIGMALFIYMFGLAGVAMTIYSIIIFVMLLYLLISATKHTAFNDKISLAGILILYPQLVLALKSTLEHYYFFAWATSAIFTIVSLSAMFFMIKRIRKNIYALS